MKQVRLVLYKRKEERKKERKKETIWKCVRIRLYLFILVVSIYLFNFQFCNDRKMTDIWNWAEREMMKKGEVDSGTSIIAVEFEGGVVLGADSRTSTGSYVANRVSDKLTEVHDTVYCCRSGSAADTQAISDIVRYQLSSHGVSLGENRNPQVLTAANLFKKFCYDYKDQLMAGIIVAGYDNVLGGQVYSVPIGGTMVRQPYSIGGSGSTYIYAYCDSAYRPGMTADECRTFVKNALSLAMSRDGSSGGVIRTVVITKDGVDRDFTPGNQLPNMTENETFLPVIPTL
jgi:20S proteasome subunit beta 1